MAVTSVSSMISGCQLRCQPRASLARHRVEFGEPRWLKGDGPPPVRETLIPAAIDNGFVVIDPQPFSVRSAPFPVFLPGALICESGCMPTVAVTPLVAITGRCR
jgi:hypothetical protein